MSCYHPLKAFRIGTNPETGKAINKICSYGVHHLELKRNGTWEQVSSSFLSDNRIKSVLDYQEIPCGKCIGCRLDYSRQWANRCMLELGYHGSSYFVTLTYDDDHVPIRYYADPETGEAFKSLTLEKRAYQLFMKRLRKRFSDDTIRFFACGEYGSNTFRPHYHAILFGLELPDLKLFRRAPDGYNYYVSEILSQLWPFGFVLIGQVSWDTCAYTARYVVKKLKGQEAHFYDDHNIEPPFILMSRKPGIARQYYDDHPDLYDTEYINISTQEGGRKFKPPKYYDRLFDVDCPEKSAELKEVRQRLAKEAMAARLANTDLGYLQYLEISELNKMQSLKHLERNKV